MNHASKFIPVVLFVSFVFPLTALPQDVPVRVPVPNADARKQAFDNVPVGA